MKLTPKIVSQKVKPVLELFRELEVETKEPQINALRGNVDARILIIAPPCDAEEYLRQVPFSNASAQMFHELLLEHAKLHTNKDALIVSCNKFKLKPNKESSAPICSFIKQSAERNLFDLFISVGDDAFKFIFGRGLKPSMPSIQGTTMYVPETCFKPVFVFPSPTPLAPNLDDLPDNDFGNRERYMRERLQTETIRKIASIAERLKIELAKVLK